MANKAVKKQKVGTLVVDLQANTSNFEKALDRLIKKLERIVALKDAVNGKTKIVQDFTIHTGKVSAATQKQIAAAAARGLVPDRST
jgi:hypothetical protein